MNMNEVREAGVVGACGVAAGAGTSYLLASTMTGGMICGGVFGVVAMVALNLLKPEGEANTLRIITNIVLTLLAGMVAGYVVSSLAGYEITMEVAALIGGSTVLTTLAVVCAYFWIIDSCCCKDSTDPQETYPTG